MNTTTTAQEVIISALPAGSVRAHDGFDYDKGCDIPQVYIYGNYALGAVLNVEVAKVLGHLPTGLVKSTAMVNKLAAVAAGLRLENDRSCEPFLFAGEHELNALAQVLASRTVTVYRPFPENMMLFVHLGN